MRGKALIHFIRYWLGAESAASQTTVEEREALARQVQGRKHLLEIGVFEGLTTAIIADAMPKEATLFAVDPFFPGRLGICWGRLIALMEIRRTKPKGRVMFIRKLSFDALGDVPAELDFAFLDGDHSLDGIKRDWADWSTRIRPGGIIALHDTRTSSKNPGVESLGSFQYFESHIRHDTRFELIEQVDTLSLLQRIDPLSA